MTSHWTIVVSRALRPCDPGEKDRAVCPNEQRPGGTAYEAERTNTKITDSRQSMKKTRVERAQTAINERRRRSNELRRTKSIVDKWPPIGAALSGRV
jgi:hypothetical protein